MLKTPDPDAVATLTTHQPAMSRESADWTLRPPIIVATDGTEASAAGVASARLLAQLLDAPVQLISVIEPQHTLIATTDGLEGPSGEDIVTAEERLERLRAQQKAAGNADWTIEIKFGDPALLITKLARDRHARLVVMGRRAHGRVDQLLGDDTVFDVIRLAETPVLVVTEPMTEAPRTTTVAVDFSELSTSTARAALQFQQTAGVVYLLHVRPRTDILGDLAERYGSTIDEGFKRLLAELGEPAGVRLDAVELTGNPAREILDFAESSRSQLLVVGSYTRGLLRRIVGGAMAGRLMRAAPCPILVVPEMATEDAIEQPAGELQDRVIAATVHELTRRNAGRKVLLEIDNGRVGSQLLAFDYVFQAAEFDPLSEKVYIVLADAGHRTCRSVTHELGRPVSLDLRRSIDGRDHVVRLTDRCGEGTITFW